MSTKLTPDDAQSIIARASNPYKLNTTLKPVDLAAIKEKIDPQGPTIKAKQLIDTTFTIVEMHPWESTLSGKPSTVYWVKAVNAEGELFNTNLSGGKVVAALEAIAELNAEAANAAAMGDDARVAELEELGANRPLTITLRYKAGGKFGHYYDFE
jgi:hypothetical protein